MRRGTLADRRIRLLLAVLVLCFAASLGRAVWLQAVRAGTLSRMAERQHRQTVEIPASRGTIVDRTGTELALGESATTVYADPVQVRDPRAVAAAAGRALGKDPDELYPLLADRGRRFVYLQRKADPDRASALARRRLDGLVFVPEERRAYPQRSVAAHVLGFAGLDNRGLAGLERSLDGVLAGTPGRETFVRGPFGRAIDVLSSVPQREGRDVWLTLDHNIQANAEEVLRATVRKWRASSATAVVLEPRTGAILAMAVAPGFDANGFHRVPVAKTKNRAVTDT